MASSANYVVDNTEAFSTTDHFITVDDVSTWVKTVAKSVGVVLIKKRSKLSKKKEVKKVWWVCDRSGEYKFVESSKVTSTKKINCPFEIVASRTDDDIKSWTLSVLCGMHNHMTAENWEGHPYAMRLNETEQNLVADLTEAKVLPSVILSQVKNQNENNYSSLRTIYNERRKLKLAKERSKSPMERLLLALEGRGFLYQYKQNVETDELEDLFFSHPISIATCRTFPQVLLMDATYKTNRYNMPFLQMVGVTSTNSTFSIGFVAMNKEKVPNYVWALNQLKFVMGENYHPRVIVTDRELALINACATVFPESYKVLCRWHISQSILRHRASFNLEGWNHFHHLWDKLVASSTHSIYMENYMDLVQFLQNKPGVLNYLNNTWLDPYKEMFVSAWTDHYLTYGNNTTNRVESQHAVLKNLLKSTKNTLDVIVETIHDKIKLQNTYIKEQLERSKIKVMHRLHYYKMTLFNILIGKVSIHALEIIYSELERLNSIEELTDLNCGCQLRRSHGLPCAHELSLYSRAGIPIPLSIVDVFWRTLQLSTPTKTDAEEVTCDVELENFRKRFADQPTKVGKLSMLQKLKGIFAPATVGEPSIQKNTRGRPAAKTTKGKHVIQPQAPLPEENRRYSCSSYRPIPFDFDDNLTSQKGKEVLHGEDLTEPRRYSCSTYRPMPFDLNEKSEEFTFDLNEKSQASPFNLNDMSQDSPFTTFGFNEQPNTYGDDDFISQDPFLYNLINDWQPSTQGEYGQYGQYTTQEQPFQDATTTFYGQNMYHEPQAHEVSQTHPLLSEIPSFFQPYVTKIEDVIGDGNCGFRSVALAIGLDQNEWPRIREDLLRELYDHQEDYKEFFGDYYGTVEHSLHFPGDGFAKVEYWIKMPETGIIIANKYRCIVYFLTNAGSYTYFPLWTSPRVLELNQSITIAFVNECHFVTVELQDGHPMPRLCPYKSDRTKLWKKMYKDRLLS